MSDVELVIKISEETYNGIKMGMRNRDDMREVGESIENGTPLPKGHGRLVDVDVGLKYCTDPYEITYWNERVPAILEADKESEDKECIED